MTMNREISSTVSGSVYILIRDFDRISPTGGRSGMATEVGEMSPPEATASLLSLASASQQPYVSELLSFTLDRLHKEPELLRVDAERIQRQMQEVAVGNYRAFITAADALLAIRQEVSFIDKHLESLIGEVPKLTSGCTEFIDSAENILEKRKMNQALLANHSTLLDLLEIPQLMDTCVRNGNFDEALDLEAFVSKLATMHPKPETSSFTLKTKSSLDVKIASYPSTCSGVTRMSSDYWIPTPNRSIWRFLRCREAWLTGILEDLDQKNAYEYLKGMINCHRMHLFDVVNQYRAIFADDTSGSEENYDGGLLFSWAMHQITSHLKTLKVMLPKITEGGAVLNLFSKNMSTAVENFQLVLDSHRWVPLPSVGFPSSGINDDSKDDVTPPSYLMEHPPLAVFINGLQAVSDSLLRYNTTRMLRLNESNLFLSLCRAFVEVVFPHCATCFGRCYPGGASIVMDAKSAYEGLGRILAASSSPEPSSKPARTSSTDTKSASENGVTSQVEEKQVENPNEKEDNSPIPLQIPETTTPHES
ncbi:unnamed protein product [Thlaspi arvense]|uniref:Conserved oligomeric Golgi complex subunit 8 n=1 Tax=Thlaspi arvense TaxID=13288 RepID=A0AAU9SZB8_THLAR|nr:unnamed protein product [Thlaspi arvense]